MKKLITLALIALSLNCQAQTIDSLNKLQIQPVLLYDAMGNVADTATQLYINQSVTITTDSMGSRITIVATLQNKYGGGLGQPQTYTSTYAEWNDYNDQTYLWTLANKRIYGNKLIFK